MKPESKADFQPCVPGVFPGGLSRTRFFDGMMLTEAVLDREQRYWRMKRRLTNRALGQGVVWGLRLTWDARACRFLLGPGYAIDCCGNDLIVECPQEIPERVLLDKFDPAVRRLLAGEAGATGKCPPGEEDQPRRACIVLKYEECLEDPEKVYKDPCSTNVTRCEFSSVRESTRLLLVPPRAPSKPSALEEFCECFAELRESKDRESKDMAGVFPEGTAVTAKAGAIPLKIRVLGLKEDGTPTEPGSHLDAVKDQSVTVTGVRLRLIVEPGPGYVLLGGKLQRGNAVGSAHPFGMSADVQPEGQAGGLAEVNLVDLEIAPLLLESERLKVSLTIALSADQAGTTGTATITDIDTDSDVAPVWCGLSLMPGPWLTDDPECVKKALVLSVLCGWFKGLLGEPAPAASSAATKAETSARQRVAWWICAVAWRLLFGAEVEAKEGHKLVRLLERLLKEWCRGFVYPGPHCADDHHGVYLGCVELSPKGSILRFDAWEHRRHVLTGPLLEHWGHQFGLAAIDVVVSRFVRWICCVAETKHASKPDQPLEHVYVPLTEAGAALYHGADTDLDKVLKARGLTRVDDRQAIDLAGLVHLILQTLLGAPSPVEKEPLPGRRVYSADDRLFLLIPVPE